MKKLIFRNFLKDVTLFLIVASISLTLIVWVIQAVNYLDFISEDGHGLKVYFYYTILSLPKIFYRILPFIFFISFYFIIIRYEAKNELIIFWNNGITKINFINTLIRYSLIIIVLQLFLGTYLVPKSQDMARSYIKQSSIDYFPSLIKEKSFIDTVSDLTIFVEKKDSKNNLTNIYLKEKTEKNKFQIIHAKKGAIIKIDGVNYLNLRDGKFINNDNGKNTIFSFENTRFNLSKFKTKSTTYPKIQEVSSLNLFKCISILKKFNTSFGDISEFSCNENIFNTIKQELYKRILIPFNMIILCLIGSFLLIKSKDEFGYLNFKIIVFFSGFLMLIISEITTKYMGEANDQESLYLLMLPIILFTTAYFYLYKKLT